MTSTDVATRDNVTVVSQFITRLQPEIARALPKGLDADRIARLALTVVRQSDIEARKARKPENSLANCSVESFGGALLTAAALGLEPGVNGEAYLVPYKGECTLIVGYQGYAKLFWQHPLAAHLDAHAVHENDEFDFGYGLAQYLRHKPARGRDRGAVTDYYAVAELSTGASAFVVLTVDEVKKLRGGRVGPSGKIPDPLHWMERKTALRQLFKLLPKSANTSAAIAVDEQRGSVLAERGVAAAIDAGDPLPALPPTVTQGRDETDAVTVDEITGELVDDADAAAQAEFEAEQQRGASGLFGDGSP
jgi:recombination protein RecT